MTAVAMLIPLPQSGVSSLNALLAQGLRLLLGACSSYFFC
jgi:hypothetical protein